MRTPKFLYFDLGNVLLNFSIERMCRQMGEVAGLDPAVVHRLVFDGGLEVQYEMGRFTRRTFYEAFCEQSGARADRLALQRATEDIFHWNISIVPVVAQLSQAGYRTGILSNTNEGHWEHCLDRYLLLREAFAVHALSYRIGAMKPDRAIFAAAAELAGVAAEEIFFTDDIPGHIAGACAAGFDAVLYTSTPQLVAELRRRGVRFNY